MNLTTLKAAAEAAKIDGLAEFWPEGVSPDDVLLLVEVARLSHAAVVAKREADRAATVYSTNPREARIAAMTAEVNSNTANHNLKMALRSIEP